MVLNYIWISFFLIAFVIALVKLIVMGDYEVFPAMMDATFSSSKTAFEISLGLTGVLALWLGIMKIGVSREGWLTGSPVCSVRSSPVSSLISPRVIPSRGVSS